MVDLFRQDSNNAYLSNGQIEKLTFKYKNRLFRGYPLSQWFKYKHIKCNDRLSPRIISNNLQIQIMVLIPDPTFVD